MTLPRLVPGSSRGEAVTTNHRAVSRYYGEDGKQILTAGRDQALRYTSVVRDSRSVELSQGAHTIEKPLMSQAPSSRRL